MKTYTATVSRDGKWWMVAIPEIDGLTQARRLSEVKAMARDYIAVSEDIPIEEVSVTVSIERVGGITSISSRLEEIAEERRRAEELERRAREQTERLAKDLAQEISLRDVGTVLGVSHQRAHQLVSN